MGPTPRRENTRKARTRKGISLCELWCALGPPVADRVRDQSHLTAYEVHFPAARGAARTIALGQGRPRAKRIVPSCPGNLVPPAAGRAVKTKTRRQASGIEIQGQGTRVKAQGKAGAGQRVEDSEGMKVRVARRPRGGADDSGSGVGHKQRRRLGVRHQASEARLSEESPLLSR